MSIQFNANSLFAPAWNKRPSSSQNKEKTELEQAMEKFNEARSVCDGAADEMMDEHHRIVAESAKKMDEYYKQKMLREQTRQAAEDRQELNERALLESINHRNLLESQRLKDSGKKEDRLLKIIS